jgi:hypothetical protein
MTQSQRTSPGTRRRSDSGQSMIFVLLALGIFLLAAVAFGVDFANFWFHRQAAQSAADAACTAGVMDLLSNANTGASPGMGRFPGGNFDCKDHPTSVPCQYAALNGYNGSGSYPGNSVLVSFVPTSGVPGIDPDAIPGIQPNSIRVDVIDHVQTFFWGLLAGKRTQDVHVGATCAVLKAQAPIPLIVLNPTCSGSMAIPGNGSVTIVGGPNKSVEVNSTASGATALTGSGLIDLSHGGPSFSGSEYGSVGTSLADIAGTFLPGTTGAWLYPSTPISDPYAYVPPPDPSSLTTDPPTILVTTYPDTTYGCPDHSGCTVYQPGRYTSPIVVQNKTALFIPGLYYFDIPAGGYNKQNCGVAGCGVGQIAGQCNYAFVVRQNGIVRPAMGTGIAAGDGSMGVTFYFNSPGGTTDSGSVFFGANAGNPGGRTVDDFSTLNSTYGVKCPGGPDPDTNLNLPANLPGDVVLGPCTQDGTYFSSPSNQAATGGPLGPVRGLILFADRRNGDPHSQPSMQGGGGLLIAGTMYFHHCPEDSDGSGASCNAATDYKAFLQFQGASGSGTFLLGNITTDQLVTGGGGLVSMQLDSARVYTILKATLIQ